MRTGFEGLSWGYLQTTGQHELSQTRYSLILAATHES